MRSIEAATSLDADEPARHISLHPRHGPMAEKYGEACTRPAASSLISRSVQTNNAMLKDGGSCLPAEVRGWMCDH